MHKFELRSLGSMLLAVTLSAAALPAAAQSSQPLHQSMSLSLGVGEARTIDHLFPPAGYELHGAGDVVSVRRGTGQMVVSALKQGHTRLTVEDEKGRLVDYEIDVTPTVQALMTTNGQRGAKPAISETVVTSAESSTIRPLVHPEYRTAPGPEDEVVHSLAVANGPEHGKVIKQPLIIRENSSAVLDFHDKVARVAVASEKIADVVVTSPYQVMVIGKQPGNTSLVVWHGNTYELQPLRIESHTHQQVLINVTVAELNRSRMEQQGVDMRFEKAGIILTGLAGAVSSGFGSAQNSFSIPTAVSPLASPPVAPLLLSQNTTYAVAQSSGDAAALVRLLQSDDLAKILAEPRLLANSGEEAKFLSGGEIPIIVTQAFTATVQFKEFGTRVTFTPLVIGENEIELHVQPEVSKPDFSQGVQLLGFTVPAFVTRRADTSVRLRDDQTLIIAGLMLEQTEERVSKVPYLGDVPYLGGLFRSTSFAKNRSELLMTVTPQIVNAVDSGVQVAMPTDGSHTLSSSEVRTKPIKEDDVARPRLY